VIVLTLPGSRRSAMGSHMPQLEHLLTNVDSASAVLGGSEVSPRRTGVRGDGAGWCSWTGNLAGLN
jgi:hypothetical protein